MRPFQVLEMQNDVLYRLENDHAFRNYIVISFRTHLEDTLEDPGEANLDRMVDKTAQAFYRAAKWGEAFHVTEEMCMLIESASELLDEEDFVDAEITPTPMGIVRFDKPYGYRDARGVPMKIHWAAWDTVMFEHEGVRRIGLVVSLWNDGDDPDIVAQQIQEESSPEQNEALRRIMGRWNFIGQISMVTGDRLGPPLRPVEDMTYPVFERLIEAGLEPQETTNAARHMHSFFLMMKQTVVRVSKHQPNSKERRRLKKMPIPGYVTVIELRRSEYPEREPGESHVEWSHRWVVRGHWRWQACGKGRLERKRTWVKGHIKGPQDMPLVPSKHIYDLRR